MMDFIRERDILKKVEGYILSNNLISAGQKILVGVSGGIDSVVLLHMLLALDFKCVVAHMNFQLRGEESDLDEGFAKNLAATYGCAFFTKRVDTRVYASDKGVSIEMAARDLRYEWFKRLVNENNAECLAVGHHLNDSIETVFLNLTRATGIRGVAGIDPKVDNIIRPLLCLKRKEVIKYAKANDLSYREDASNEDIIYKRNLVRHHIIPRFEDLESAFVDNMDKTLSYLRDARELVDDVALNWKKSNLIKEENVWKISFDAVYSKSYGKLLLFEVLKDFGFRNDMVALIHEAALKEPGRRFFSEDYVVYVDRDFWYIINKQDLQSEDCYKEIPSLPFSITIGERVVEFSEEVLKESFQFSKDSNEVAFDYNKICFPLIVRKWQKGDWFIPFGMKGKKKISDFLIDNKVSLFDKSNVYVLESADNIVWVIGYRLDNRFKIDADTSVVINAVQK